MSNVEVDNVNTIDIEKILQTTPISNNLSLKNTKEKEEDLNEFQDNDNDNNNDNDNDNVEENKNDNDIVVEESNNKETIIENINPLEIDMIDQLKLNQNDFDENETNHFKMFTEIAELTAISSSHTSKLKNQSSEITNLRQEFYKLTDFISKLKFEIANLNRNFVTEQTIREMINRSIDVYDKNLQTKLLEMNRTTRTEIFNYQKDVTGVENQVKEIENKLYNQSVELSNLSETISPILNTREELSQLKYYVEKNLKTDIENLITNYTGKALDTKIQKWITFYHDNHKSVKLDFDRLYSENKELVENIKNDYSLVGNIKNEIKKELFNDIVEYNSKFRDFLENKKFIKYLEDLSLRSDRVLNNIMREQETRRFFEELKKHIDEIKE